MNTDLDRFLSDLKAGSLQPKELIQQQSKKWRFLCLKYSTVTGSVLLLAPNSLHAYWSNLSVYSLSYLVPERNSNSGLDLESTWVLSTYLTCWTLMAMMSGLVIKRIGRRYTVLLGAVVSDLGLLTSYFAVQNSLLTLTLTLGVVHGFGTGLIDSSILQIVMDWADNDTGKLSAGIQAAQAFGGFIINQFMTFFLNPSNLSPHFSLGQSKYFTQTEIIDRVPTTYLILAAFALPLHLLGFCLLRQRPKEEFDKHQTKADKTSTDEYLKRQSKKGGCDSSEYENTPINLNGAMSEILPNNSCSIETQTQSYTPREMLQTKSFYVVWITFFMGSMSFLLVNNYFKSFGQLWNNDDHFLTYVGTTLIISDVILSLLWGVVIDKFGVKNCFIIYMAALAFSQVWYYFTAMLNRWLFLVGTIMLGSLVSSIFSCYTATVAVLYGKLHVGSNFGVVMTSSLSFNMLAPYVFGNVLQLGWFVIFAIAASLHVIRLVLVIILIPAI